MKTLRSIIFFTADAPALPVSPMVAGLIQAVHFGHVQASFLNKIGQTFSLGQNIVWRGRSPQSVYVAKGAQFSIFKELDQDGVIDLGDTETAFYCQVWGPVDDIDGVGMCDSRWWYPNRVPYAPRFMDPPSCVKDILGMPKTGTMMSKFHSWTLQAKGRIEHEIAHSRIGENIEWYNYPDSRFTPEQITALRGSPFLWVK